MLLPNAENKTAVNMPKSTTISYDREQNASNLDTSVMNMTIPQNLEQERIKDLKQAADIQDKMERYYALPMVRKAIMLRTTEHVL